MRLNVVSKTIRHVLNNHQPCSQVVQKRCSSQRRILPSKHVFPQKPTWSKIAESELPPKTTISAETIEHLERLALVDFGNEAGIQRLEAAIRLADELSVVDTRGVEPLVSPLEDTDLYLREDKVTEGGQYEEATRNAAEVQDGYFIVPKGNVVLRTDKDYKTARASSSRSPQVMQSSALHTSCMRLAESLKDQPVVYSMSKAAQHTSYDTFGAIPRDIPKYQRPFISFCLLSFLLYAIFREENDIDLLLDTSLYEMKPELEEQDLRTALKFVEETGRDTDMIRARLAQVEARRQHADTKLAARS